MADPRQPDERREGPSATDWERLRASPDLHEDLGYELLDLEAYETDGERILFLPKDEDMMGDDAFIVVGKADVHTFGE